MQQNSNLDWQKVYSSYSPKLLGICRRYIQDIYTAEDIVQDSFITAIQKDHQLNDEKALFAWLKKIVVNNALQHIRKNSKNTFVDAEPSEIPDTPSEMEYHFQEEKNAFIYDFTNEELLSSIDHLPSHHKSVFNLFFIENYSHSEISNTLGITVNTSKSHLLRAKKSVQNYLLNHIVKTDTPKKKTAQLLVVFGLGGLLWARTFQSKFSDFTVQPSRPLQIPADIKIHPQSFSSSNNTAWKKKTVIGGTILVIIIVSVFLSNPGNSFFTGNNSADSLKRPQEKQVEATFNSSQKNEKSSSPILKPNTEDESLNEKDLADVKQTDILKTTPVTAQKDIESGKNSAKTIRKYSVKETPEKVIVVKKIIKRDTVFIER